MELGVIKNDVAQALRTNLYYNELEIGRLAQKTDIEHKQRVENITYFVRENAQIIETLKLLDVYFRQPVAVAEQAPPSDTESGNQQQ